MERLPAATAVEMLRTHRSRPNSEVADGLLNLRPRGRIWSSVGRVYDFLPNTSLSRAGVWAAGLVRIQNAAWRPSALQVHLSNASMPAKFGKLRSKRVLLTSGSPAKTTELDVPLARKKSAGRLGG